MILLTVLAVPGIGIGMLARDDVRGWVIRRLGGTPILPPPPAAPGKIEYSLRQTILSDRDRSMAKGDLVAAARVNAMLGQEALRRAEATQRSWLQLQDPKTKLLPEQPPTNLAWQYKDSGADNFGFLLQAGFRLNPASLADLNQTLAAETRLAAPGELCHDADSATARVAEQTFDERMFGSTEYVKDGLLSVYERYGDRPEAAAYSKRMFDVLDAILANAAHQSKFGPLPGTGGEENGNVLQACSRLSFSAPNGQAYAEMAARIADAYVEQVLPKHHGLPVNQFDFKKDRAISNTLRLRDHGNEVIPGLTEAYAMAVARSDEPAWRERADRWSEPLARMLEILLTRGIEADGMFASEIDPQTMKATSPYPNDNWAYVMNAAMLYSQAARRHGKIEITRLNALDKAVDGVIRSVTEKYGLQWEKGRMDGYADTLEGGLYMLGHRPSLAANARPWVDDQIAKLFDYQRPDGFAVAFYLDGNFIRTSLMYADLCSGGWTVEPWRPDVSVGHATGSDGQSVVVVRSQKPYTGVLRPERNRHQQTLKLPWDWPRLNSWPEHFALHDGIVLDRIEGTGPASIENVRAGLPLTLPADGQAVLRFREPKAMVAQP